MISLGFEKKITKTVLKLIDKDDLEKRDTVKEEIDDYKYWDEDSLKFIRKYYEGEIGES